MQKWNGKKRESGALCNHPLPALPYRGSRQQLGNSASIARRRLMRPADCPDVGAEPAWATAADAAADVLAAAAGMVPGAVVPFTEALLEVLREYVHRRPPVGCVGPGVEV